MTAASAPELHTPADAYVAYEYNKVRAPRELEPLYIDTYRSFGWAVQDAATVAPHTVELTLKRDRRIRNRPMVQELQRKALTSLARIAKFEQAKTTVPVATAIGAGLVGCVPLAASVFMITGGTAGFLSTVLGVLGLAFWGVGTLAYFRLKATRTATMSARIDEEQDTIFEAGEQAALLLR